MTALKKTNAMRLLEQAKVPFEFYEYETSDGKIDAKSVAAKIGQAPEQVFKTLVTQSPTHEHFVFVVPSIGEQASQWCFWLCGLRVDKLLGG